MTMMQMMMKMMRMRQKRDSGPLSFYAASHISSATPQPVLPTPSTIVTGSRTNPTNSTNAGNLASPQKRGLTLTLKPATIPNKMMSAAYSAIRRQLRGDRPFERR
jgi:hypothetical protein